mmetsp:Transcript_42816/g.134940  ORF Transcript_42816/g.134940 Transcript_42816/m.134940 type:complete len:241 (-) Transcript_42816:687-1409(-)
MASHCLLYPQLPVRVAPPAHDALVHQQSARMLVPGYDLHHSHPSQHGRLVAQEARPRAPCLPRPQLTLPVVSYALHRHVHQLEAREVPSSDRYVLDPFHVLWRRRRCQPPVRRVLIPQQPVPVQPEAKHLRRVQLHARREASCPDPHSVPHPRHPHVRGLHVVPHRRCHVASQLSYRVVAPALHVSSYQQRARVQVSSCYRLHLLLQGHVRKAVSHPPHRLRPVARGIRSYPAAGILLRV